jgi:hypothetical protein
MMSIITTLLQPFVFLLVLLIELYKAVVPSEGISMKDTIKSARGTVREVKDSMAELKDEFKEEPETITKKDI